MANDCDLTRGKNKYAHNFGKENPGKRLYGIYIYIFYIISPGKSVTVILLSFCLRLDRQGISYSLKCYHIPRTTN